MSTVATKIERTTEAIESLVLAQVAALQAPPRCHDDVTDKHLRLALNIKDARDELATAFKDMLTPTLRVVNPREHIPAPDARPVYPAD